MSGASTPPSGGSGTAHVGARVLIVEDNSHIIEMHKYVLRKLAASDFAAGAPLEVRFATDGQAALAILAEAPVQLVLTDLFMPVVDGFELITTMRATPAFSSIPIIAISAGGADARARALSLGAAAFLGKPVRFAELMDVIKQQLRLR